ncbi:chemotaxis protein CheW [Janthinobacterium agaricidamnosum]|uniref:Chemotaxis protein CheW n=1 Tax=Janthinobacterium agaricidamnosum NBRC 102515 = DSM 9628 TaxID=1349767 RepID=W0V4Z0_9BURK|nr:chemotaxis protein CheW [Janthinobacterium agaricidamnosum]CDG83899.1 cheW-like domain protein [Janthinobacterium agaricidamnosum NBRC 102515 = DSM 9628]
MQAISTASMAGARQQYLSFQLGGLEYGLDFRTVQELRPFNALERLTSEGAVVSGVVVSRGVIMPIVDMRLAFGSKPDTTDPLTDVIILKLSHCVMGMVVDGVTDIVTLDSADIVPVPGTEGASDVEYLLGMGQVGGRRLILIDIDKLMAIRKVGSGARQAAQAAWAT